MIRILDFLLAALFFVSAIWQFNDPDPLVWSLFYGLAGAAAMQKGLGNRWTGSSWFCLGMAITFMLQTAPGVYDNLTSPDGFQLSKMSDQKPSIELSREFGGALIVSLWSLSSLARSLLTPYSWSAAPSSGSKQEPNSRSQ